MLYVEIIDSVRAGACHLVQLEIESLTSVVILTVVRSHKSCSQSPSDLGCRPNEDILDICRFNVQQVQHVQQVHLLSNCTFCPSVWPKNSAIASVRVKKKLLIMKVVPEKSQ